jgi:hypothetical protein
MEQSQGPLEKSALILLGFWTNVEFPSIVLVQFVYFSNNCDRSTLAPENYKTVTITVEAVILPELPGVV